jgi:hypothetical protein
MLEPGPLAPLWASKACYKDSFTVLTFTCFHFKHNVSETGFYLRNVVFKIKSERLIMSRNIIFVLTYNRHKLLDLIHLRIHDSHYHDQGSSLCPPIPHRVPSFPRSAHSFTLMMKFLRTVGTDVSDYMVPQTRRQSSSVQVYQF